MIAMEDDSVFLKIFGDTPINRVLDFLIIHEEFDYSMKDIAKNSGVGYATLKLFWHNLENAGIVVLTRGVGRAKLYRLNNKNSAVLRFKEFFWETVRLHTKELIARGVVAER